MSGVINDDGQWERCNACGRFVLLPQLKYEEPSPAHPYGRDLCFVCKLKARAQKARVQ